MIETYHILVFGNDERQGCYEIRRVHLRQHLFVLQTIIVFQRKSFNHIDFAFLRNCFLSCGSNTINHASYEMCMRKIPCDKDSVSTLKSSNSVKFQFSHVFCRSRSFFPRSRSFFCRSRRWKTRSLHSSMCTRTMWDSTHLLRFFSWCFTRSVNSYIARVQYLSIKLYKINII